MQIDEVLLYHNKVNKLEINKNLSKEQVASHLASLEIASYLLYTGMVALATICICP